MNGLKDDRPLHTQVQLFCPPPPDIDIDIEMFNCSGHETVKLRRRLIEGLGGME